MEISSRTPRRHFNELEDGRNWNDSTSDRETNLLWQKFDRRMTSANVYNVYAVAAASSSQVDSKIETDKKLKERSAALSQSQLIRTRCFWRPMIGHRNTSRITPFCTDTPSPDRQTKILKKTHEPAIKRNRQKTMHLLRPSVCFLRVTFWNTYWIFFKKSISIGKKLNGNSFFAPQSSLSLRKQRKQQMLANYTKSETLLWYRKGGLLLIILYVIASRGKQLNLL